MFLRFVFHILIFSSLVFAGVFSCAGGGSPSGAPAGQGPAAAPSGIGDVASNAAAPETPPSTVSLDPNCEQGAKPQGDCKGSLLPPPFRPCPSNLTVIKDFNANVWWCGCPEGTQEIKNSDGKRQCVCPSGQGLMTNVDKGEALGCPINPEPQERDQGNEASVQQCVEKLQNYRDYASDQILSCIEQFNCRGYGELFCLTALAHEESFPANFVTACARVCDTGSVQIRINDQNKDINSILQKSPVLQVQPFKLH